jgi:lipoprotein NlpI
MISGCASLSPEPRAQATEADLANLVIAEPIVPSYRAQHALFQLNQAVQNQQLADSDRAQLLYQRGLIYDKLGLDGFAMLDFRQAQKMYPALPDVYNSLGIHYLANGEYEKAYEAFDATLEFDNQYAFAFFNRGLTAYYHGRYALSVDDLDVYVALQPDDPLRHLWRYFAARKLAPDTALLALKQARPQLEPNNWMVRVVDVFLGTTSTAEIFADVLTGIDNQRQLAERLCEVYFYLAKYHQAKGQTAIAMNFYKLAMSTNIYEFVEHRFARVELDLLRE